MARRTWSSDGVWRTRGRLAAFWGRVALFLLLFPLLFNLVLDVMNVRRLAPGLGGREIGETLGLAMVVSMLASPFVAILGWMASRPSPSVPAELSVGADAVALGGRMDLRVPRARIERALYLDHARRLEIGLCGGDVLGVGLEPKEAEQVLEALSHGPSRRRVTFEGEAGSPPQVRAALLAFLALLLVVPVVENQPFGDVRGWGLGAAMLLALSAGAAWALRRRAAIELGRDGVAYRTAFSRGFLPHAAIERVEAGRRRLELHLRDGRRVVLPRLPGVSGDSLEAMARRVRQAGAGGAPGAEAARLAVLDRSDRTARAWREALGALGRGRLAGYREASLSPEEIAAVLGDPGTPLAGSPPPSRCARSRRRGATRPGPVSGSASRRRRWPSLGCGSRSSASRRARRRTRCSRPRQRPVRGPDSARPFASGGTLGRDVFGVSERTPRPGRAAATAGPGGARQETETMKHIRETASSLWIEAAREAAHENETAPRSVARAGGPSGGGA